MGQIQAGAGSGSNAKLSGSATLALTRKKDANPTEMSPILIVEKKKLFTSVFGFLTARMSDEGPLAALGIKIKSYQYRGI